jgi:UDP-N-acetyl-D-mannosaminuronate dehydrogenase
MNKYKKSYIENLLRHLIYKNTTILASIQESKAELENKNMPLWIEEPVKQIFDEITQDLSEAMIPLLAIAFKEYALRPDRLLVLKNVESLSKVNGVTKTCGCAACKDNENMIKDSK